MRKRTLIVLTSDHGETLLERPWIFDHGGRLYDEQIRVPLIMAFPQDHYGKQRVKAQYSHIDLLPTVLEALRLPEWSSYARSGISLMPWVWGEEPNRKSNRAIFSNGRFEPRRIPSLEFNVGDRTRRLIASIHRGDEKLIEYPNEEKKSIYQYFRLNTDAREKRNLVSQYSRNVRILRKTLQKEGCSILSTQAKPRQQKDIELDAATQKRLKSLGYAN